MIWLPQKNCLKRQLELAVENTKRYFFFSSSFLHNLSMSAILKKIKPWVKTSLAPGSRVVSVKCVLPVIKECVLCCGMGMG